VTPTLFGKIVLEKGEILLDGFAELTREITLAKGFDVGDLAIAVGPYPGAISGQKAAGLLTARYPSLVIKLTSTDWIRVVDEVLHGRADLGLADISEASTHSDLETELVRDTGLRFFCRSGHPLLQRDRLVLDDLLNFPWVGATVPARVRVSMPEVDNLFGFLIRQRAASTPAFWSTIFGQPRTSYLQAMPCRRPCPP
jgi:DNA-binding transcriptional LysR family regulator